MISQRPSIWEELFGGCSTMRLESAFARAYNEPNIGAVIFDIDSPGGTTSGVQMAAERIYSTRGGSKPVIAVANSMACSAAYWIASAAETFVAVPGAGSIGNIGVYRMHEDLSGMLEKEGVNIEFIYQPAFKVEGHPYAPLSPEAREFQQQQVDRTFEAFNADVAKHRKVSSAHARENFGKGRDFQATQAAEMGLIDKVMSMEQVLTELTRGSKEGGDFAKAFGEELCEAWENPRDEQLVVHPKTSGETVKRRKELLEKRMAW
jgi:signal peptide peptidase SppA